jgi:hypothetical protein
MQYKANPVLVDAFVINQINEIYKSEDLLLTLEGGDEVVATKEMMSRYTPNVGDYWVIQADGYIYLNPKDVFERKYSLVA